MPLYSNHQCIFTHIPKCAGSSIHKAFIGDQNTSSEHSKLDKIIFHEKIENFFKFTFVRNPWDRFLSTYFYFKKYGQDNGGDMLTGFIVNRFDSFNDFTKHFPMIPDKIFPCPHFNPQNEWVDERHNLIGRFENLQADFDVVCEKVGLDKRILPHANKTDHKHYTEYYDNETRQIVAKKYAKDIEYFGYEFGK